jgi:drug/metabolite transporter (DMT)-like permease
VIYVLLNVILSSFFILCIKWVQGRKYDIIGVGMVNYVVAALFGSVLLFRSEPTPFSWSSILTGTLNGVCYFTAFFVLIQAVIWKGAAHITLVSRLSIVLPLIAGVSIWGDRPGILQLLGITLACGALALTVRRGSDLPSVEKPRFALLILVTFFLIAGGSRLAQEIFRHVCQPEERAAFLITAFGLTAAGAIAVQAARRTAPRFSDWAVGSILGLANLGQTFFILKALEYYPGYIVFPMSSAGGLLFTTVVAVLVLKERLSAQSYLGISLATCALALLHPHP